MRFSYNKKYFVIVRLRIKPFIFVWPFILGLRAFFSVFNPIFLKDVRNLCRHKFFTFAAKVYPTNYFLVQIRKHTDFAVFLHYYSDLKIGRRIPLYICQQHIHGKNFQDYPEWWNAIIFRIILKVLGAIPREEQRPRISSDRQSRTV